MSYIAGISALYSARRKLAPPSSMWNQSASAWLAKEVRRLSCPHDSTQRGISPHADVCHAQPAGLIRYNQCRYQTVNTFKLLAIEQYGDDQCFRGLKIRNT